MSPRSTKPSLATTISTQLSRSCLIKFIEIFKICDVAPHYGAALADLVLRLAKCALAASHDEDVSACFHEHLSSRQSYSTRSASDFTLQV